MSSDKNNNLVVAKTILIRSGLKDIKFYEGHNVDTNELNSVHLMCIFRDLVGIDPVSALEFIDLVNSMSDLSAYNFINNFYMFANNGFSCDGIIINDNNDDVDALIISASIKANFIKNTLEYAKKIQREFGQIVSKNEVKSLNKVKN